MEMEDVEKKCSPNPSTLVIACRWTPGRLFLFFCIAGTTTPFLHGSTTIPCLLQVDFIHAVPVSTRVRSQSINIYKWSRPSDR